MATTPPDTGSTSRQQPASPTPAPEPVAVIDVGSSSIRLAIAEIDPSGDIRPLDTLEQHVFLGADTFTTGALSRENIELCVKTLKSFANIFKEYQIERPEQIRAVATSAVREAANRDAFIDRIYIATGIQLDAIDEAEETRLTYLAIQKTLQEEPALREAETLVLEIGGGSTALLLLDKESIAYSATYRLGSIRLQEMADANETPASSRRQLFESQINRTISRMQQNMPLKGTPVIMALGGDARFAAAHLLPDWDRSSAAKVPLTSLARFTDKLLAMSTDDIVRRFHLPYGDAESVGPALLSYVRVAKAMNASHIVVTHRTLRSGLFREMAARGAWTDAFRKQIIGSALELGRKYHFDEAHAKHVADLCRTLFDELKPEHQLDVRYRLLLKIAALLHEIGLFVGSSSHHKHSMYLIIHSDLFGLSPKDLKLVALVARYHRRALPKPSHQVYSTLPRKERIIVSKLAAILRVADALARSRNERIRNMKCTRKDDQFIITASNVDDIALEHLALKEKGSLFEDVYGMKIILRKGRSRKT